MMPLDIDSYFNARNRADHKPVCMCHIEMNLFQAVGKSWLSSLIAAESKAVREPHVAGENPSKRRPGRNETRTVSREPIAGSAREVFTRKNRDRMRAFRRGKIEPASPKVNISVAEYQAGGRCQPPIA